MGAIYERGGVRFELMLEPLGLSRSQEAYLKLRVPRDAVVSIPEPTARLKFHGQGDSTSVAVDIKSTALDWQGRYVEEMRRKSPLAEHRFVFVNLPPIHSSGTLELPAVFVGGVPLESPVFTFERRSYAGMVPLNC